jgi:hypothetical protein
VQGLSLESKLIGNVDHPLDENGPHCPIEVFLFLFNIQRIDLVTHLPVVQKAHSLSLTQPLHLLYLCLKLTNLLLGVSHCHIFRFQKRPTVLMRAFVDERLHLFFCSAFRFELQLLTALKLVEGTRSQSFLSFRRAELRLFLSCFR